MLGINIQDITEDTAQALELKDRSGILVSGVKPGSAAEKAGSNVVTSSSLSMAKR